MSSSSRIRAAAYLLAWPPHVASDHDARAALETLVALIDDARAEERSACEQEHGALVTS